MSLRCSRVTLVVRSTLSHCFRPQVPVTYRPFLCGALQPKYINTRLYSICNAEFREIFRRSNVLFGQMAYFSSYPSHTLVKMPNLSPTMETGNVVSWAKKEGDEISEGELLAEIETDKATMSFEAGESGYLAKILAPAGTKNVAVGKPLCIIVEDSDSVAAFKDYVSDDSPPTPPAHPPKEQPAPAPVDSPKPRETPEHAVSPVQATVPAPSGGVAPPAGERIFVSPLARRLAGEMGINLNDLAANKQGTGIYGMFRASDLGTEPSRASVGTAAAGAFIDTPVSSSRLTTAQRLSDSGLGIPHYYLTMDIEMDETLKMRELVNDHLARQMSKDAAKITLNDIIIKAVAATCLKVPECNSSWQGTFIRRYNTVNVNVTVAVPTGGLVTPTVFGVESKGIMEISRDLVLLATKAREDKLQPQETQGGTITVSNLGMFGISSFCAIINPPQSCLLAVGNILPQICADSKSPNGYNTKHVMTVTLCCDHRVVDGAVGATWLSEFKSALEQPSLMLI